MPHSKVVQSCLTLCNPGYWSRQGLNPGLPHFRRILYQLSQKGSPRILEWVACPFSIRSSWPRNRTGISCIASRFLTNWAIRETKVFSESWLFWHHILNYVTYFFKNFFSFPFKMRIFKHMSFVLGGVDGWAGLVRAERPWALVINCGLVAQGYFLTSVSIQVRKLWWVRQEQKMKRCSCKGDRMQGRNTKIQAPS